MSNQNQKRKREKNVETDLKRLRIAGKSSTGGTVSNTPLSSPPPSDEFMNRNNNYLDINRTLREMHFVREMRKSHRDLIQQNQPPREDDFMSD